MCYYSYMRQILQKIKDYFSYDAREVRRTRKIVEKINQLEEKVRKLSDEELLKTADEFRERLGIDVKKNRVNPDLTLEGRNDEEYKKVVEKEREKLMEVLPEIYARVREVARRVADHRHFDVQLIGGILLAEQRIIEVYTGEGKTNIALLPAALYGLTARGVHIHTVNNYLAKRDAEWAGHILSKLGFTVAVITSEGAYKYVDDEEAIRIKGDQIKELLKEKDLRNMSTLRGTNLIPVSKQEAYLADIVYGEANEFGFDYLRDNMAVDITQRVQRSRYFAIVDEADSILIDEARVPLIISQPDQESTQLYIRFASIARQLEEGVDYVVDEKSRGVTLTEEGVKKVEKILGIKDLWLNTLYLKHLHTALKAKALFKRDRDYIVKDGQVLIVDEFTGRVQPNRRYSEGLHQAIEAKEGVPVKAESKTLATISHQNYYRMYTFLAGMTGTAATEREEFRRIYGLDVVVVPTYRPIIRKDYPDMVFKTKKAKYKAIVKEVKKLYQRGQPVLVGTSSIEASEELSDLLKREGIPHQVLNAKHHEKEAQIIAKAGQKGSVTIATNMAGRGTDIKITDEVRKLGGLVVLGAQRHEARRIDNQLRGRTGRLGDPGYTRFYLSLEDDLLRIFGGDIIKRMFESLKMDEEAPISSRMITRLIEKAQRKVESMHFDIRRRLVEFDDVVNIQRDTVYELRRRVLVLLNMEPSDFKQAFKKAKLDRYKDFDLGLTKRYLLKLDEYSLLEPYEFGIPTKYRLKHLFTPLRWWILKQLVTAFGQYLNYTDFDLLTKERYDYLRNFLDAVFPDPLWVKVLEAMGYTPSTFKERFRIEETKEGIVVNPLELYRVLITGFDLHLSYFEPEEIKDFVRIVVLQTLDQLWMDYIDSIDDLRTGIFLRGYAQRDPLVEFKQEANVMFDNFFATLQEFITKKVFHLVKPEEVR